MQLNLSINFSSRGMQIPSLRRPPVATEHPCLVKRRLKAWAACCSTTTTSSGDSSSQQGHPQPHSQLDRQPWNKGLPMSESTKHKLSQAAKKRWAENPQLRTTLTAKLPNNKKKPWNAGGNLSEEHKQKISEAMKGTQHSKASKSLMRAMALARSPASEEAKANMSKALKGKPKSEQHRAAIAATMRKRHAATRALKAVEAVYLAAAASIDKSIDDDDDDTEDMASSSQSLNNSNGAVPIAMQQSINNINSTNSLSNYSSSPSNINSSSGFNLPSKNKVLAAFKGELREFRLLQKELTPWTENFVMAHNRKPGMVDVQRTGITWLIEKYKRYILLREHIRLSTQQGLKAKLTAAASSSSSGSSSSSSSSYINNADFYGSGGMSGDHPFNSQHGGNGGVDGAKAVAVARMLAAKNYKEAREREASSLVSSSSSIEHGDMSNTDTDTDDDISSSSGDLTQQQQHQQQTDSHVSSIGLNMARTTNVDPRVREAVRKAQAYRTAKVQATVKKAEAAALLAGNGWHDPSLINNSSTTTSGTGGSSKKVTALNASTTTSTRGKVVPPPMPMAPPPVEVLQAQAAAHSAEAEAAKAKVELESEYERVTRSSGISSSDDDENN